MNQDDWGNNHPFNLLHPIRNPMDLIEILDDAQHKLTVDNLGLELVKELFEITISNPCPEWKNDANRERIPATPDAEGILRPLKSANGENQFYLGSDEFPDLLSNSRRLHSDFISSSKHMNLNSPDPVDFAKFIHEKARDNPQIFNNLRQHKQMHLQVSGALVKMAQSGISKPELANYNFIPATHKEKTILRKWNQIGSNVWGFGKQLTYTSFYDRNLHSQTISRN